jgi:hypothetical protein
MTRILKSGQFLFIIHIAIRKNELDLTLMYLNKHEKHKKYKQNNPL